ncbi:hypothetical protein AB1N83_013785 [Pleurotus pulmonarius]
MIGILASDSQASTVEVWSQDRHCASPPQRSIIPKRSFGALYLLCSILAVTMVLRISQISFFGMLGVSGHPSEI